MNNPEEIGRTESLASGCEPFDPKTDDFVTKDRKYTHFDYRLNDTQRGEISLATINLSKHDFWPLIAFGIPRRKRMFDEQKNFIGYENKPRPIKFGSHMDAAILELYSKKLGELYESYILDKSFRNSILAYRKSTGDNVKMAKSLFDEITNRGDCVAIAVDVSGFFDNIEHDELKECLKLIFGVAELPDEDYHVFRNITRYSYVESTKLRERLGKAYKPPGRLCYPRDFRKYAREQKPSIVEKNPHGIGIPQGTPISGLYANISMLSVDENLKSYCESIGASYRRYSDDIAVVLPKSARIESVLGAISTILKTAGLEINESKTDIARFSKNTADKPFQYLGFTFDGQCVRIRQSSIHNYYRKMRKGIRAKIHAAKAKDIPPSDIYMRHLMKRYTHFGKGRNFTKYAYRAATTFSSDEIKKQLAPHMKHFEKFKNEAIKQIYK